MPDSVPSERAESRQLRFEAVALPFMRPLYNTALRLSENPEDAADLVQETMLRAFRTFDGFRPGTNGKAWLFTILYSVFFNQRRKARREVGPLPADELEQRFARLVSEGVLASESWAEAGELEWPAEIDGALRSLSEESRSAVILVDVQELSYEEAAAVLGCPIGTLRSRLFRARRMLAVLLLPHARRSGFLKPEHP